MRKLVYINNNGDELDLCSEPLIFQKFDDSGEVNIYSTKGVNQDGLKYLSNTLKEKDISLQIAILATDDQELNSYTNKINKVFNPKIGEGYLVYTDDYKNKKIKGIINKLPYFTPINNISSTCLINLTACTAYWTDIEESKEEIALWQGDFEFELELTDDGIEMGHREPSLIVNVLNEGDVECGMRVEFKALATVVNPSILNVNTQEYIKINKTMSAGEVITVTTGFGNKKITSYLNGVTTNAMNYIDFQSTFLQLDVGDNLFRYDAEVNLDNLEVSIYFMTQYLGV